MTTRPAHHAARYHVAGLTERGPVGSSPRITSMGEYVQHYGGRTEVSAVLYDDLALFFAEGGWEAYVSRVVGPGATRGSATLYTGVGVPTLSVEFNEAGPHSGEHSLIVEYPGDGTYEVWLARNGIRVDHWKGLTSPSGFASAAQGHRLITVTALGTGISPTAGTTAFAAGSIDAANITPGTHREALDATGGVARGGCVATPGVPAADIGAHLIGHAADFQKIALLAGSQDTTVEELATTAASLALTPGADHAGVFWPWVSFPGAHRPAHQPPTGYVAAARARAITTEGYWRQPAGSRSTARTIGSLRFPNTPDRNEEISEQLVCPIVATRNGVQIHGWWSLSPDRANFPHLVVRDLLNNVAVDLAAGYAKAVNHTWDTLSKLTVHVTAVTKSVLGAVARDEALTPKFYEDGGLQDPGYTFRVHAPSDQPADRNVVEVHVEVRPKRLPNLIAVRVFRVDVRDPFILEVAP